MIALFETAWQLQVFCDQQGWNSCFIGGIAVQRWGEPRVTRDVDLTLLAGFGGEDKFIDALTAAYSPRIVNAQDFARRNRVLLLQSSGGVRHRRIAWRTSFRGALGPSRDQFFLRPGARYPDLLG